MTSINPTVDDAPLPKEQENALVSLLLNIIVPTVVLSALSKEGRLGPFWALIVAAVIPASYGIWFAITRRQFNLYSAIGVVSVLLTGILGLVKTEAIWIAIKEMVMPLIIAVVILLSHLRPNPFVASILLNPQMVDRSKISAALESRGTTGAFRTLLWHASLALTATLVISAAANFFVARYLLDGKEPGGEEFVGALGTMNWVGFLVIGIPMMAAMVVIMMKLMGKVSLLTGLETDELLKATNKATNDEVQEPSAD